MIYDVSQPVFECEVYPAEPHGCGRRSVQSGADRNIEKNRKEMKRKKRSDPNIAPLEIYILLFT